MTARTALLIGLALAMGVVALILWRHDRGIALTFVLVGAGLIHEARTQRFTTRARRKPPPRPLKKAAPGALR